MNRRRVGCAIVVAAALLGCGKKASKARVDDAAPVLTAGEQCTEMLEVLWISIHDKLVETGIDPENPGPYLEEPTFLRRCAELTDAQRACIVDADDPVMGIHDCGVNRGRELGEVLRAPTMRWRYDEGVELPAEEQAARLKLLIGEWRGTTEGKQVTWRVSPDGWLDETGLGEPARYRVGLARDGRISHESEGEHGSATFNYVFVQVDAKRFYANPDVGHLVLRVDDPEHFAAWTALGWLKRDGARCRLITQYAETPRVTCATRGELLVVEYIDPPSGDRVGVELRRIGDYLVDARLIESSAFDRR